MTCFQTLRLISEDPSHKTFLCKKFESTKVVSIKVKPKTQLDLSEKSSLGSMKNEQSMLKYITQLELPLVQKLQYSFQDNNALYLATVRCMDEESLNLILCALGPLCLLTSQCYSTQIGRR